MQVSDVNEFPLNTTSPVALTDNDPHGDFVERVQGHQARNGETTASSSASTTFKQNCSKCCTLVQRWPDARSLIDFLDFFVPNLSKSTPLPPDLYVIPSPHTPKLEKFSPDRRQSLKSLLFDAIQDWHLAKAPNILTFGFGTSENHHSTQTLVQRSMQTAVDYWLQQEHLHGVLGDDVLRYLWSQQVVHVAKASVWIQVSGPPLWRPSTIRCSQQKTRTKKRKRSRKVDQPPKPLRPETSLFCRPLLYNNMYTKHVGLELPEAAETLLIDILKGSPSKISSPLALSVCAEILRNHRRLDYHRLLAQHCPLPHDYLSMSLDQLSTKGISEIENVTKFVVAAVAQVLPIDFWGHEGNKKQFLENVVPAILRLRRQERFPNHALLHGIRITHMKWLCEEEPLSGTRRHHKRWHLRALAAVRWLVHSYFFVLLQRTFYITETQFRQQTLCHYRKPVWALLRSRSWKELSQLKWIPKLPDDKTCRFESDLRLLPKISGVRPIALQKASNRQLASAFAVLKESVTDIGAGVTCLGDFYPKYRKFILAKKPEARLHFISVDIRQCFDNIQTNLLLNLVSKHFAKHPEHILQKYYSVKPSGSQMHTHVRRPEEMESLHAMVQNEETSHQHPRVLIDLGRQTVVRSAEAEKQIRALLENHFLKVEGRYNNRYLIQTRGVPQGSILSALLCNIYYKHVEEALELKNPGALLVRMVDDFVLVSTDTAAVDLFLATMNKGAPDLGVEINADKTRRSTEAFFTWCGFRFETRCGNVRVDFSKLALRDSLRVERVAHSGVNLEQQCFGFCRPRCLPILFDPDLNDLETRAINFYEIQAFAAVRTVYYLQELHGPKPVPNPVFVAGTVRRALSLSIQTISRRLEPNQASTEFLRPRSAFWLGHTAWIDVFSRLSWLRGIVDAIGDRAPLKRNKRYLLEQFVAKARSDFGLASMLKSL